MTDAHQINELVVEKYIAAPPEIVWRVMTERTAEWWCPKPWMTEIVEQDWRAGGRSAMIMRGPNGEEAPSDGVFLEVTPNRRFVFTDAFTSGWVPQKAFMVGIMEITPDGKGTCYRGSARHWDEAALKQHEAMGFVGGWNAVADQLAELSESVSGKGG
jgi:uncharacterized protein YndB with AHSA1/START domain